MIYLVLSILLTTTLMLIFKLFERFNINNFQAIVFNYITAGSICFFVTDTPLRVTQIINEPWFTSAFLIGILFICGFNLIAFSAQKIGIAITSVATKISLCIPIIFGFIYYGDQFSFLKISGICLALISIYFTSKKDTEQKENSQNYILIPVVLFVCTGLIDLIFIYSQESYEIVAKGLELKFSAVLYSIAGCIGVPILIVKLLRGRKIELKNVIAGFNITCIGDDRCYSFMPSRQGNALSDRVGNHILKAIDSKFISYSWLDRGGDERQYCAPGVDLPITSLMRSKYAEYPEYHTSLDDLSLISQSGLQGGLNALIKSIEAIEKNCFPTAMVLGEPQLGKRGLYPEISTKESTDAVRSMMDLLAYSDGTKDLVEIAEAINVPVWELYEIVEVLVKHGLLAVPRESL